MGLVYAVELLPIAILGIPSGMLVAKYGSRRTAVVCDAAQTVLIALIPVLHVLHTLPFWLLLVVVGCTGVFQSPYFAAQRLMLPEMLAGNERAVTAGNALLESTGAGARMLGPALAGVLIASMGALNVLWIDAGSFAVSAFLLAGLPKRVTTPAEAGPETRHGVLGGARYSLRDPLLVRLTAAAIGYGMLMPFILISMPLLATSRYNGNPHVAGWLFGAFGAGAVAGTFLVIRLSKRIPPLHLGCIGGLALVVPLWFLPLPQPALSVVSIMAVCGIFIPMLNAPLFSLVSTRPPEALRAQVMTFITTATQLAGPVAYAVAGVLFGLFGLAPVQLAAVIGLTVCGAVLLSSWRLKVDG
jgi:MFS family permease